MNVPTTNQGQTAKPFHLPRMREAAASSKDSKEFLELLAERLPPVVARKDVERILGGVIASQTLNNADAKGEGPEVAYRVGRSVVYRTDSLLAWIAGKFEIRRIVNLKAL